MLQMIISLLGILTKILAWGSLLYTVWILVSILQKKRAKGRVQFKEWIIFGCWLTYMIIFILVRIFLPDLFASFFSILFIIILIITTQWTKYEDRKTGRRWWEQ